MLRAEDVKLQIRYRKSYYINQSSLECLLIHFEKNLHGGRKSSDLDFAPKSTLVAAHTFHDTRDVPEAILEFGFEYLIKIAPPFSTEGNQHLESTHVLWHHSQRTKLFRRTSLQI